MLRGGTDAPVPGATSAPRRYASRYPYSFMSLTSGDSKTWRTDSPVQRCLIFVAPSLKPMYGVAAVSRTIASVPA